MHLKFRTLCLGICALLLCISPAKAGKEDQVVNTIKNPAIAVAQSCLGQWKTQGCVDAVIASNDVMVTDYGFKLENAGFQKQAYDMHMSCRPTIVPWEGVYPAASFQGKLLDCVQALDKTVMETKIQPVLQLYQVMVGTALCLGEDTRCNSLVQMLAPLK